MVESTEPVVTMVPTSDVDIRTFPLVAKEVQDRKDEVKIRWELDGC